MGRLKNLPNNKKDIDKIWFICYTKIIKRKKIKTMTKEEMLTEVIKTRGFEDKWTIWFAELVENKIISDNALQKAMVAVITMPFDDEDEDE